MFQSLFLAIWIIMILLMTCTTRFELGDSQLEIYFTWTSVPEHKVFFLPLPNDLSEAFILQKIGHIIAFTVLAFLLMMQIKAIKTIHFTLFFALLTEILQLYVSRGGRLFDVGFDLVGAAAGLCATAIIQNVITKAHVPPPH